MNKGYRFLLMGSDKRQKYLYEILCEKGYTATYINDEELEEYIRLCEYNRNMHKEDGMSEETSAIDGSMQSDISTQLGMVDESKACDVHSLLKKQNIYYGEKGTCGYNVLLLPVSSSAIYFDKLKCIINGDEYIFGCNLNCIKEEIENGIKQAHKRIENNINSRSIYGGMNYSGDDNKYDEENIDNNSIKKLKFYEYMADDETAYKNAIATAEGVIAETIIRSDININGSNCLITGYGRCARIIADRFKALNSNVTIIERIGHKRAQARAYGYNAIDFNSDNSSDYYKDFNKYDYVINTVPQMVVDKHMLEHFNRNVTIIDIASRPGGVDYDYCKKNNINAVNALGLPGKYSPKTSALILYDVICDKLSI